MPDTIHSRLAPTPSGYLHMGNGFNFLLTEALVRQHPGRLRLRIDDLDAPRIRDGFLEDIFESLAWLDIVPDEGPRNAEEHLRQFSQSLRIPRYDALLQTLVEKGRIFACSCSRKDVAILSKDGQYPGTCRGKNIPLETPGVSLRFRTEPGDIVSWEDGILGNLTVPLFDVARDFIVRRRDGLPAYHIASLSDDTSYGINLIVRGRDLLESTAAQLCMADVLGLDTFLNCRFYHHPVLTDSNGDKLSKTARSSSLKLLRSNGLPAEAFRAQFDSWLRESLRPLS